MGNRITSDDDSSFWMSNGATSVLLETLSYDPPEEYLIPNLRYFRSLIEAVKVDCAKKKEIAQWYDHCDESEPRKNGYPYCVKYHILLS